MKITWEHIVIGVLILAVMGVITLPGFQPQPARIVEREVTPGVVVTCDSTVTPTIDINAYDVDNPTSEISDTYNLYRKIPGGSWVSWDLGNETSALEFGETYEFLIPGDLTASNSKAVAFGKYIKWTAPCKETTEMKIYIAQDETYDGLTNSSFDADGTANTDEAFGTGDVQTIALQWKAGSDEYYGHPYLTSYPMLSDNGNHRRQYPNILCLKLNSTVWETPQEVYLDTGETMNRVSNPTISAADGATTHIMYCYEAPVITDRQRKIYMTLEADGTYEPLSQGTAYLYAGNIYINTNTGAVEWGVENNEGSYVAGNGDADEAHIPVT